MNIIELFEKLNIDKNKTIGLSQDEIIRIEKQVNVERKINPEIEVNVASNLIDALKNYPLEFQFITNHRVFYNFFAKKNYSRDKFFEQENNVSEEQIKSFLEKFLEEELTLFFEEKMAKNGFLEMSDLLIFKSYLPEVILHKVERKTEAKIDFIVSQLNQNSDNKTTIEFIKQVSFYQFLSHFSSPELDENFKSILNIVVDNYNGNKQSSFEGSAMIAMSYYDTFDDDLKETLENNKNIVLDNRDSKGDGKSNFSWRTFGKVIFVLIKIAFFTNKCDSDNSRNTNFDTINFEGLKTIDTLSLDKYYTNSQAKIDTFQLFLTDYDKSKVKNIRYNDSIKTGQNPFETIYNEQNSSTSESFIMFKNTTNYDVIVLENTVVYDTINIAKQAYFIKSKQSFKLDTLNNYKRTFNFYIGKKLGSFHNENEKLYVRNGSIVEPRFTELVKNANQIIKENYQFDADVEISEKNEKIVIDSKTNSVKNQTFEEIAKDQTVLMEEIERRK